MSNTKHTPGPWTVKHSESKTAFNVIGTALGGKYKIARCPYFSTNGMYPETDRRDKAETEANAQLIAAAPELLEALSNYKTVMERFFETLPDELVIDLITAAVVQDANDMAKRALAKAEGKEVKND
jgi:hypothetical protein